MSQGVVGWVSLGIVAAIIAWDVFLATDDLPRNTISQVVVRASRRYPSIPLAVGYLMGHLWPV